MPIKSVLFFLTGFLTFCLGLIASVLSALDKVTDANGPYIGALLAWAALTALIGTIAAALVQTQFDSATPSAKLSKVWAGLAMGLPLLSGCFMAFAAMRLGGHLSGETAGRFYHWFY